MESVREAERAVARVGERLARPWKQSAILGRAIQSRASAPRVGRSAAPTRIVNNLASIRARLPANSLRAPAAMDTGIRGNSVMMERPAGMAGRAIRMAPAATGPYVPSGAAMAVPFTVKPSAPISVAME